MRFRLTKITPPKETAYLDIIGKDDQEVLKATGMFCTGLYQRFAGGAKGATTYVLFLKNEAGEIYHLDRFYEIVQRSEP